MSKATPANPAAVAKNSRYALRRILHLVFSQRRRLFAILFLLLLATSANVIAPKLLGDGTNVIVAGIQSANGIDFSALSRILITVLICYSVFALMNFLGGVLIRIVVQNIAYLLREKAQTKIARLSLSVLDSQKKGDLLSRVTNDIDNLHQSLMQTLNSIISAFYTILGITALMFWISWQLTLVSLLLFPIGIFLIGKVLSRSRPQFHRQWELTGKVSSIIEKSFTGQEIISAFSMEDECEEIFTQANEELFQASFRGQFLSQLPYPIMSFISNLSFVVVAIYGGLQVISGTLTIGGMQAFMQYSRQLNHPISSIAQVANLLQSGAASGERIFDFLDLPEMPAEKLPRYHDLLPRAEQKGRVEFSHLCFGYNSDTPIIKNFNLQVPPGQQIAIVGPTGAGKTTLVNLLMRFYESTSGIITIDGIPIEKISPASLRAQIGMVLQDTWLFSGTISDNIAFGNPNADIYQVQKTAVELGIDQLIRRFPHGYSTLIDAEGSGISAGEKQLLTIARAYIADPAILILDEATSSVDTRTEMLIQQAMKRLRKNRTSFVIAHRLSTIREADQIVVMEDGEIVEQGKHTELLAAHGAYYHLYKAQLGEQ